jgi:hypothetical protein
MTKALICTHKGCKNLQTGDGEFCAKHYPKAKDLSASEKKEIQVIEKVIENQAIAPQDAFGKLSRPQVDLIKRTIAKGASDDELKLFIQVCKGAQLNPFMKQVFLVPRWDSREGKEVRAGIRRREHHQNRRRKNN